MLEGYVIRVYQLTDRDCLSGGYCQHGPIASKEESVSLLTEKGWIYDDKRACWVFLGIEHTYVADIHLLKDVIREISFLPSK